MKCASFITRPKPIILLAPYETLKIFACIPPPVRPAGQRITRSLTVAFALLLAGVAGAQPVPIPDPNLEAVLREAVAKPDGELTALDLLVLTSLDAPGRGIVDTTGLEAAGNLVELNLNDNPVTNYSGVAGLTRLRRLLFDNAGIQDLSFLADLEDLTSLEIYGNAIQDISPLGALAGLQSLQLDWNPVTNHWPLTNLMQLERVSLAGNGVTNLDFTQFMPALRHLGLYCDQVKDLSPLAGRTELLSLGLGWSGVTNLAVLATLTGLEELLLNGNPLTNVVYLAGLTNLTSLALDYTELVDMSPVTNLTRLAWLNVGETGLADLPDLSSLTNLHTFMMAGNQIGDLSPVTNLTALTQLHAQRNRFTTIAPLADCPLLEWLLLGGNSLTNVEPLAGLTNLMGLALDYTGLVDVPPVTNVRELDLRGNRLTDLSGLTNCPHLWRLSLQENYLTEIGPLLDCPALGYVNLKQNPLDLSLGSPAWNVISNLLARGVQVEPGAPQPSILLSRPANRAALAGDDVVFYVNVLSAPASLEGYRWQKDGVDLADNERLSGSDSDTLRISNVTPADAGLYRLRVWDEWTAAVSAVAELKIITTVAFADPNLEAAVRDELGIPTAPLTPEDLAALTRLDATSRELASLSGLEAAVNLESLCLTDNRAIQSFEPLSYLPELRVLLADNCGLSDLGGIGRLTRLTELDIGVNLIRDLTPLRDLTELNYLTADWNHVSEIGVLTEFPNLLEVHFKYNHVDTNSAAPAWAVITELIGRSIDVDYDPQLLPLAPPVIITQPRGQAAVPGDNVNLYVEASGDDLEYQWQKNGVNLPEGGHYFNTWGDRLYVDDVTAAESGSYRVLVWNAYGLTNSRTVQLYVATQVAFADPQLEQAVREALGIPDDPLTLDDLATLTGLDASRRGITNLSGLEAAIHLQWLNLGGNPQITDLSPLRRLAALTDLQLYECNLADVAPLAELYSLTRLDVNWNRLRDLAPLTNLTDLTGLFASYNADLTNQAVVTAWPNLRELGLAGDRLARYQLPVRDGRAPRAGPVQQSHRGCISAGGTGRFDLALAGAMPDHRRLAVRVADQPRVPLAVRQPDHEHQLPDQPHQPAITRPGPESSAGPRAAGRLDESLASRHQRRHRHQPFVINDADAVDRVERGHTGSVGSLLSRPADESGPVPRER